jgi:hypothetical protein
VDQRAARTLGAAALHRHVAHRRSGSPMLTDGG